MENGILIFQNVVELFLKSAEHEADQTDFIAVEQRGVRTVFHGTNHAVMDAILRSGLDPMFRQCETDFFGIDYGTSLGFSRKKTTPVPARWKLLVFMVIAKGYHSALRRGAITVGSNRFQLPLAEITL